MDTKVRNRCLRPPIDIDVALKYCKLTQQQTNDFACFTKQNIDTYAA